MTTTKTTVREYDEAGRMVKETVTEVDDVRVMRTRLYCNCAPGVMTSYCPLHGYKPWPSLPHPTWTVSGQINTITADDKHYVTYNGSGVN